MNRPGSLRGWTITPLPNPSARLRLFCFPYAGGGATIFSTWPRALPPEVEVVAVQPPGREGRIIDPPIADLGVLVAAMYDHLLPLFDRPFAFFGHSNGGLMAFELTRLLRRRGGPMPRLLVVSGRPAPQVVLDEKPIHALPDDAFIDELRRFKGTPDEILQNREIMELLMPLLRADFALGETYGYTPEPPLDLPVVAYGGERDDEVPPAQIEAWREQAGGAFRCAMFPGDHFFVNGDRPRVLADLSRELAALLSSPAAHAG